jgi:hypothetical protein
MSEAEEIKQLATQIDEALRWGAIDWCIGRPITACPFEDDQISACWKKAWRDRKARSTFAERWLARPIVRLVRHLTANSKT